MYTIIPFRYVDASNFKQYDEIVFEGELTQAEIDSIGAELIDEHLFVPADLHLGNSSLRASALACPLPRRELIFNKALLHAYGSLP